MAAVNLATLAAVKTWAGVTTSNDDLFISQLITNISRMIMSFLQRETLFQTTYNETQDGIGGNRIYPLNYPILSVSSLTIGNQTIPATGTPTTAYNTPGYLLDAWNGNPPGKPQAVTLRGYQFWRGSSNIAISYTAGFVAQNEAQTVPASSPYNVPVNQTNGNWAVDQGVTYAIGGAALTLVTGTPTTGQYSVNAGVYTFASGDSGKGVLISYSYVPYDIGQACVELVAERYSYRQRIGLKSKGLGGQESVAYNLSALPDYIKTSLQPYKRVML